MLRWHIHYNLLILRMLSFACDLHWARTAKAAAGKLPTPGAAGAGPDDIKVRPYVELLRQAVAVTVA